MQQLLARHDEGREVVRLLDVAPDLERAVPAEDREFARRRLVVPARTFERGPLAVPSKPSGRAFAWIVLDGVLLRKTSLDRRPGAELLGEGDIISIRAHPDAWTLESTTDHVVHHAPFRVAVLDDRFRLAARRWPLLHDVLFLQQAAQMRRSSRRLAAALGLPRVEDRLAALFADLADRWGRVTVDGIVVDMPFTHDVLGDLVGARRPTVGLALTELAETGRLTRRDDQTWMLSSQLMSVK